MIPILYSGMETEYRSNGLGRLNEIISCTVTEERNGIYELEFEYPVTGRFYQQMVSMVEAYATGNQSLIGTVACIHDDKHDIQPFDLYAVSAPIDGIATFNAHHVSYRLGNMVLAPFTATSAADAMTQIPLKIAGPNNFTFWTDKGTGGSFELENPEAVRNILGGQEGSLLDVFGTGEYEFDKFTVKLYQNRNQGFDSGVTIRYGKNLTDFERELDGSGHFNAIAPYWKGQITDEETSESQDVIVYLSGLYIQSPEVTGTPVVAAIDFSSEFREIPTQDELRARALKYLSDNKPWLPDDNVKISFVQLWQTTEYADIAALQRLSLCDTVNVYYPELGIIAESQKIIKVTYNVLLERYDEMELGKPTTSLASSISSDARANFESELEQAKRNAITSSQMQAAIAHATELITGGLGGFVVFTQNADGEPQEILIMDTDDVNTAVHVIRINQNGIGFSSNGYQGPFTSAWTIDGSFNADFITAGSISANMLSGGTLKLGGKNNGNGVMRVYDAYSNNIGIFDKDGIELISSKTFKNTGINWSASSSEAGYKKKIKLLGETGEIIVAGCQVRDDSGAEMTPVDIDVLKIYSRGTTTAAIENAYSANLMIGYPGVRTVEEGQKMTCVQIANHCENPRSPYYQGITVGNFRHQSFTSPTSSSTLVSRSGVCLYADIFQIDATIQCGTGNMLIDCGSLGGQITTPYQLKIVSVDDPTAVRNRSYPTGNDVATFGYQGLSVGGSFFCSGYKGRLVQTEDYSNRLLYCYETAAPMFGDIGEATIDETGTCYIFLDPVFAETVSNISYQIFLQRYGEGECYVSERKPGYFIVSGTPGLSFAWELKAKQADYSQVRLGQENEYFDFRDGNVVINNYSLNAANYIKDLEEGRMAT